MTGATLAIVAGVLAFGLGVLIRMAEVERRRQDRFWTEFEREFGPSRPTLDSELNKDRTGKEGREI